MGQCYSDGDVMIDGRSTEDNEETKYQVVGDLLGNTLDTEVDFEEDNFEDYDEQYSRTIDVGEMIKTMSVTQSFKREKAYVFRVTLMAPNGSTDMTLGVSVHADETIEEIINAVGVKFHKIFPHPSCDGSTYKIALIDKATGHMMVPGTNIIDLVDNPEENQFGKDLMTVLVGH